VQVTLRIGFECHSDGYNEFYLLKYNCVVWLKSTDVTQEHGATIFRSEESAKQETSMKKEISLLAVLFAFLRNDL
jgi:hypothetical protein